MAVIPQEYQEVEWIKATSGAYIQTGINPEYTTSYEAMLEQNPSGDQAFCGGQVGGRLIGGLGYYNSHFQNFYGGYFYAGDVITGSAVYRIDMENGSQVGYIDGVESGTGSKSITTGITERTQIYLFGISNIQGNLQYPFTGKCCWAKIYTDGLLRGHFIPVYRKADNEPGMYDSVSGTFFTNAGTGDFVVGPDVTRESLSMLWLRRRMMMPKKAPEYQYITIENAFSNASTGKTEISSLMTAANIDRTNKIVVLKSAALIANNKFLGKSWINLATDSGNFLRYRNSSLNNNTWGNSSADCSSSVGDEYYVIDPSASDQPHDTIITVQSNIITADALATLIESIIPETGVYAVYRLFDPSNVVQYDYFWSIHNGTSKIGFRADGSGVEAILGSTSWSSSYDTHVYAGDKVCFLKLFDT